MPNPYISYRCAVRWIAEHDQVKALDAKDKIVVLNYNTVKLLSEMFSKDVEDVAEDVLMHRIKHME